MQPISERQQRILARVASGPVTDASATELYDTFGVNLGTFRAELRIALAHPDGPATLDRFIAENLARREEEADLVEILLFEVGWRPRPNTRKDDAIRDRFGISRTTYGERLAKALAHPVAAHVAPSLLRRRAQKPPVE